MKWTLIQQKSTSFYQETETTFFVASICCCKFVPSFIPFFSFFHPHFLVFQHFYHGPTLTTPNSTLVLEQINEVLEKMKNQTGNMPSDHNQSVSLMGHAEGHELIFLPESLVLCTRERPILCLLLMLGTLWLGYALYLIKRRYAHLINYFS